MPKDLKGKRIVVTGAASGIGRAIAESAAGRGARVLLADIDALKLESAARAAGPSAKTCLCDVSDHKSVEALALQAQTLMGGCDMVFVNAGIISSSRFVKFSPETVDKILGVNVRGAWSTAAIFARQMMDAGQGGHICFTGSEHSLGLQHAGAAIYTASKHAVLGLAEVLRAEMPEEIKVSILCPGLTATALGSLPEVALSDAAARAARRQAKLQARGMPAREVAHAAIDGALKGDFYIMTHAHAVRAAEYRYEEIRAAFEQQAPPERNGDQYEVNRVLSEVLAEEGKK